MHYGSGVALCLYVLGLLLCVARWVFPSFAAWMGSSVFWGALLPTLMQSFLAFTLAGCGSLLVFSLVASSRFLRRIVRSLITLLIDVPALGWVGFVMWCCPSFLGCILVAAFSVCAQAIHAVLEEEETIPLSLVRSARALRMTPWQCFWRLQIPVAVPRLMRAIVRDIPDFWVRLIGSQAIIAVVEGPKFSVGIGAQLITADRAHEGVLLGEIFLATAVMIALCQHAFIVPLLWRAQRYEAHVLAPTRAARTEEGRSPWWQEPRLLGVWGALGVSFAVILVIIHPWYRVIPALWQSVLHVLAVLLPCFILWGFLGGALVGVRPEKRCLFRLLCSGCVLIPVFLCDPFLSPWGITALMIVSMQGALGWGIFLSGEDDGPRERLYQTAQRLHLPSLLTWRYVRIPLVLPPLLRSMSVLLPLLWNQIYLAEMIAPRAASSTGLGNLLFSAFQLSSFGKQAALLILMTLLAFGVRHAVIVPLQLRFSRKYRVSP
ncbi:hypothetical protein GS501_05200 [Saccharibacter sp. 17.LH.SD]|uniref:hypothetical protein n=1 Tax=Saccharibacter sp. 17.LH.SD TaxID=2689393 RepID=UPI00136CDC30|nr:hypothetical protein [Saccharibacter sp. 17.LH.SD]MXV44443.1 hypothetical protein [Saccharibacter sp. 17.LH.SD]